MELPPAWQRPDPLRGLEDIPWAVLSNGAGVDDLLRDAANGEPAVNEAACRELVDRLLIDGTVSEASAWAVPFLAEMGASYRVPATSRDRVIFLLAALALAGAGFTDDGRRTRRRWNAAGRELPRRPPDWITQTRYGVAKCAPKVFETLAGAEVACSMALAIAVPEVVPAHVVEVADAIASDDGSPRLLAQAARVARHVVSGEPVTPLLLRTTAQGHPELLRAYRGKGYPPNQPAEVTLQLMGYRYAFLAAYGDQEGAPTTP
ncbi:hypothetical protein [Saccharothrix yanglingensis]|uniref:Uncharacterized protein n=1 Tax=Saccharothrix yanglingensis TaxID=659496 RepID=A0ABU0WTR3_9PSEU|nr:hypothetical protein [Saccharothrix yanglingensis]MDQ2583239.1 hypothetical protein [Saccharothrix yanglingensis]